MYKVHNVQKMHLSFSSSGLFCTCTGTHVEYCNCTTCGTTNRTCMWYQVHAYDMIYMYHTSTHT